MNYEFALSEGKRDFRPWSVCMTVEREMAGRRPHECFSDIP